MKMVHVTIYTASMEESIKFYEEVVGLKVQMDMRQFGGNIVFLAENEGDTQVELIEDAEKAYKGSGISMGFRVEDVESKRDELVAMGIEATPMIMPNPHVKFFFVKDPNGLDIQFIQYQKFQEQKNER